MNYGSFYFSISTKTIAPWENVYETYSEIMDNLRKHNGILGFYYKSRDGLHVGFVKTLHEFVDMFEPKIAFRITGNVYGVDIDYVTQDMSIFVQYSDDDNVNVEELVLCKKEAELFFREVNRWNNAKE